MKRMNLRKTLSAAALIGATIVTTSTTALAQPAQGANGMMVDHGIGAMGGYGWMWLPIVVVIAAAGLVAWIVSKKRK